MHGVALTSLWVAAWRAAETERPDALFRDPYARRLAGPEGEAVYQEFRRRMGVDVPTVPVRTWFFDQRLRGLDQVVLLASGMDARAWRIDWAPGTRCFELDHPSVLALKHERIGDDRPRCLRLELAVDLREEWPEALRACGFDRERPALWLVEGLLPYLPAPAPERLFERLDALSAPGSRVLTDVIGRSLLDEPRFAPVLDFPRSLGAPWVYGTDTPEDLLAPLGWIVDAHDIGEVASSVHRWPRRVPPRDAAGLSLGFLLEATKRA